MKISFDNFSAKDLLGSGFLHKISVSNIIKIKY